MQHPDDRGQTDRVTGMDAASITRPRGQFHPVICEGGSMVVLTSSVTMAHLLERQPRGSVSASQADEIRKLVAGGTDNARRRGRRVFGIQPRRPARASIRIFAPNALGETVNFPGRAAHATETNAVARDARVKSADDVNGVRLELWETSVERDKELTEERTFEHDARLRGSAR